MTILYFPIEFEWDDRKAILNWRKHGIAFSEATLIWRDLHSQVFFDPDCSEIEDRWIRLGLMNLNRILVVSYCERGNRVRIISARIALKKEAVQYWEQLGSDKNED